MKRLMFWLAALTLFACLSGCPGISTYDIRPFHDANTDQFVCCAATVTSGKDVSSVTVDVTKNADNYTIHFQESGVSATAPIAANSQTASAVAGAVSNTAISAAKILH